MTGFEAAKCTVVIHKQGYKPMSWSMSVKCGEFVVHYGAHTHKMLDIKNKGLMHTLGAVKIYQCDGIFLYLKYITATQYDKRFIITLMS